MSPEDAVRMTGALFIVLNDRPGMFVNVAEDNPGNQLEVEFDLLPGRYRITVEEIYTKDRS